MDHRRNMIEIYIAHHERQAERNEQRIRDAQFPDSWRDRAAVEREIAEVLKKMLEGR